MTVPAGNAGPPIVAARHCEHVAACLACPSLFRPWELRFLTAMGQRATLTKRQRSLVTSMLARVAHQREGGR